MKPDNTSAKLKLTIGLLESLKDNNPKRISVIKEHIEQLEGIIEAENNKYRALANIINGDSWSYTSKPCAVADTICTDLEVKA